MSDEKNPFPVKHNPLVDKVHSAPVASVKAASNTLTEKEELLAKIQKCLMDHSGLESNIGVGDPYWKWLNELRGME